MKEKMEVYVLQNGIEATSGKSFINPDSQDASGIFIVRIHSDNRVEYHGIANIYATPLSNSIMDSSKFIEIFSKYELSNYTP